MNRRAMSKLNALVAAIALSLTLAGCGSQAPVERPPLEGARIGGPFTLADKHGNMVRWSDFAGKYRVVYFGYTFCPDACPLDIGVLMKGFDLFARDHPAEAARVQPMFISIDPARDTPQVVGQFAAAFSPRLLGLTGTPEQVDAAAKAFAAPYSRGGETAGGYLMDHVRIAYLMGPRGEPIATLPIDQKPEDVASELAKWVR
jgi:protein SCO1/2